jgi:hypothetical protein
MCIKRFIQFGCFIARKIFSIFNVKIYVSTHISVGMVTRLQAGQPRNQGSIPGRGKKVYFSA